MNDGAALAASEDRNGISNFLKSTINFNEGSTGALLNRMLQAARVHTGMEVSFISEFEGGYRVFRHVDNASEMQAVQVGGCDPLDESFCQGVVEGWLPELILNAQEHPEAQKLQATTELGIGAHISTPIRLSDGSVFGTFCCFSRQADNSLNTRDAALIQTFAEIAGKVVENDVQAARDKAEKRKRIERVLDEDQLEMVWQPIMDIATGSMVGAESLARFKATPERAPPAWFDEAAAVGLAHVLERRAMKKGLDAMEILPKNSYVAFNASAHALMEGHGLEVCQDVPLDRVLLEITEHDVINDYHTLREVLAPWRQKGLRIAVDDAGAGYASFQHILQLKPDVIKLDMSLTRDIDSDIPRRSLALAMVDFAGAIGSKLVAEGVETREELDALSHLGVELAQGYFLHRPQAMGALKNVVAGV